MAMNLSSVTLYLIDHTSKVAKHYSQKIFDDLGIDIIVDQWVLLKIIEENEVMSQKEIANKSFRDPASIKRTLDILEKNKLVRREKMKSDLRQHQIFLTPNGQQFINKHMALVEEMRAKSIEGFCKEELDLLHKMLNRIQNNLK